MDAGQEKRMTQYVLGQLPEHEEAEIERRYLADDSLFEELLGIEDDLRDAYERGELSAADREAFEHKLLTLPRQKEKQEFARALREYVLKAAPSPAQRVGKWERLVRALAKQRIVLVPAFSAALAALIVGGWWLGHRNARPVTGPLPGQGSVAVTPTVRSGQQSAPTTFAIVLAPGLVRGGEESKPVVIPPEASRVRLEARFAGSYPRYQAMLETVEGKNVWSEGNLQAQPFPGGERIFLDLSSSVLAPRDYVLTVRGLPAVGSPETVAEYAFRVKKK